jgi:aspartyl-tRNA synthetase
MHRYRTHTCGALTLAEDGADVRLSGWCHRIRDHGGVLFIDLRDHYGLTQCVVDPDSPAFAAAEKLRSEFVIRVDGKVRKRPPGTENPDMPTGSDTASSTCAGISCTRISCYAEESLIRCADGCGRRGSSSSRRRS